jgi:glycine cleavage system aminomethyltransferase T/glycine/D-amino acid oxidase-like deaminating enzyme
MIDVAKLPKKTRVLIVGGGIAGVSTALHLARQGVEVALVERGQLTCGTTWHAAGLVGQLRGSRTQTEIAKTTLRTFEEVEAETGLSTGLNKVGSIQIALSEGRMAEMRRIVARSDWFGAAAKLITPEEVRERWPGVRSDDVLGAIWYPGDATVNPVDATQAMARAARMHGATILENVSLRGLIVEKGKVTGIETDQGEIRAEVTVLALGAWTRDIAATVGVRVPLYAAEHYYIVTEPIAGLPKNLPYLRSSEEYAYFKEDAGKLLVGCFEPGARLVDTRELPKDFSFEGLPGDMDHFEPILETAIERCPILAEAGIHTFFCGPESFTPDNVYHLGPAPEVGGLFVAAGFNSYGIQSSAGIGKVMADWIRTNAAPVETAGFELMRTMPFQSTAGYLRERIPEMLGYLFETHHPYKLPQTARGIRRSPWHHLNLAHGACMSHTAGWERPMWFAPEGMTPVYEYSYGRQNWFDACKAECAAARDGAVLIDQSCFTKTMIEGPDALTELQRLSAAQMDVPEGKTVYLQMLNDRGGIEVDATVTRIGENRFLMVGAPHTQMRDLWWMRRNIRDGAGAILNDMTSGLMMFSVTGPRAREILQSVSPDDWSNAAFPFGTSREVEIGMVRARATRLTYIGELGWEIVVESEYAEHLAEYLLDKGAGHGLRMAGYHALGCMRVEKGMRSWPHDIGPFETPSEAGLAFAVDWEKADFIGRDAALRSRDAGVPKKRLVQVKLHEDEPLLYREEPIYLDGRIVGGTTSGNYGHRIGASLGMGYVTHPEGVTKDLLASGRWEVNVEGRMVPATVQLGAFYDPKREKVLA